MADTEEMLRLREALCSDDAEQRMAAVRQLQSMVQAKAPTLLLEALESDSAEVREQALVLLARMAESDDPTLQQVVTAVRGAGPGA